MVPTPLALRVPNLFSNGSTRYVTFPTSPTSGSSAIMEHGSKSPVFSDIQVPIVFPCGVSSKTHIIISSINGGSFTSSNCTVTSVPTVRAGEPAFALMGPPWSVTRTTMIKELSKDSKSKCAPALVRTWPFCCPTVMISKRLGWSATVNVCVWSASTSDGMNSIPTFETAKAFSGTSR